MTKPRVDTSINILLAILEGIPEPDHAKAMQYVCETIARRGLVCTSEENLAGAYLQLTADNIIMSDALIKAEALLAQHGLSIDE